eukprot:CAMPEP_0197700860 /NCGR_PEP_ID=MMETSP1338-20131121/122502_1 /TAXON_ID=43686 ORGANISM="Pelagodinium beii, Strain RCC1491" /NCGR_SAMPLE_ID=MMETSP1338 /ASSEMBLY_ACC=CAM_ASM_000754 /LENGTH=336 /DNA_ID=CAMNT_0043284503 /DNA_START=101 /DNA_END=1111 /DNA_ORIENTATION=-
MRLGAQQQASSSPPPERECDQHQREAQQAGRQGHARRCVAGAIITATITATVTATTITAAAVTKGKDRVVLLHLVGAGGLWDAQDKVVVGEHYVAVARHLVDAANGKEVGQAHGRALAKVVHHSAIPIRARRACRGPRHGDRELQVHARGAVAGLAALTVAEGPAVDLHVELDGAGMDLERLLWRRGVVCRAERDGARLGEEECVHLEGCRSLHHGQRELYLLARQPAVRRVAGARDGEALCCEGVLAMLAGLRAARAHLFARRVQLVQGVHLHAQLLVGQSRATGVRGDEVELAALPYDLQLHVAGRKRARATHRVERRVAGRLYNLAVGAGGAL